MGGWATTVNRFADLRQLPHEINRFEVQGFDLSLRSYSGQLGE